MRPLLIMLLVLVEVALWQWRVAVTGRVATTCAALLLGGVGDEEELDVINIAIADRHLPELQRLVDGISPEAVWIVERVVRGHGLAAPVVVAR